MVFLSMFLNIGFWFLQVHHCHSLIYRWYRTILDVVFKWVQRQRVSVDVSKVSLSFFTYPICFLGEDRQFLTNRIAHIVIKERVSFQWSKVGRSTLLFIEIIESVSCNYKIILFIYKITHQYTTRNVKRWNVLNLDATYLSSIKLLVQKWASV